MGKQEKEQSNRAVNKSIMFTDGEAKALEDFVRRLAVEQKERVTFSSWAHDVLLAEAGLK